MGNWAACLAQRANRDAEVSCLRWAREKGRADPCGPFNGQVRGGGTGGVVGRGVTLGAAGRGIKKKEAPWPSLVDPRGEGPSP